MVRRLKIRYLRLVRKAHRLLRAPFLKRHPRFASLTNNIFDRELWQPSRDTVAGGLSIGLFLSQLPVPFQMIFAALGAIRTKVNIPFAVASCWVTNPITIVPITIYHLKIGNLLYEKTFMPNIPFLNREIPFVIIDGSVNLGSYILGFMSCALLLSLLAYPLVYLFSAILPKFLPKTPYSTARERVLARRKAAKRAEISKSDS